MIMIIIIVIIILNFVLSSFDFFLGEGPYCFPDHVLLEASLQGVRSCTKSMVSQSRLLAAEVVAV